MNKTFKMVLLILCCILFISLILIVSKIQYDNDRAKRLEQAKQEERNISNMNQINIDQFVELFKSRDTKIVLVASLDCKHCTAIKPKINELADKLNIEVNYFEISKLTKEERQRFYKSNEFLLQGTSIPLVMAIRNNEVVDYFVGNITIDEIEKFLKINLNIE